MIETDLGSVVPHHGLPPSKVERKAQTSPALVNASNAGKDRAQILKN